MAFECPKIDGLREITEAELPFDKTVTGSNSGGQVDGQTAYELYRKLIQTLDEAGYSLKRYGISFGFVSDNQYVQGPGSDAEYRLQDVFKDVFLSKGKAFSQKGLYSASTEAVFVFNNGRDGLWNMSPFTRDDPLESISLTAFPKLLTDPAFSADTEELADSVVLYLGLPHYYLHDWMTSCAYISENFPPPAEEGAIVPYAGHVVDKMIGSAKQYLNDVTFDKALEILRERTTPWTLENLQIYSLKRSEARSGWQDLIDNFDKTTVCASPYQNNANAGFDIKFGQYHVAGGAVEVTACPNPVIINDRLLKNTLNGPILINGGLEAIEMSAKNTRSASCFDAGAGLEPVPGNFGENNDHYKGYRYQDKYGNTVLVLIFEPSWWSVFGCMGHDGYIASVVVHPKIFFANGVDSKNQFDLDLTPLGLGEYKNMAYIKGMPHILTISDRIHLYSDYFVSGQFSEAFKANLDRGIGLAAQLFELKTLPDKVIVRSSEETNAAIRVFQKDIIYIYGKDPNELIGSAGGWTISMHETFHLIDDTYGISLNKEFIGLFNELQPPPPKKKVRKDGMIDISDMLLDLNRVINPFMGILAETAWFKDGSSAGHPQEKPSEFFASLCSSLMHPDIAKRFDGLSTEHQRIYIKALETLKKAINKTVPNASNLTISRRISNTIEILRPLIER